MTDHHLPDDLASWPQDSYQLLGINAGIDEKGLKRAYAKLIRQFKPEHHPQEFARIRAAYEQIQQRLAWMSRWRAAEAEASDDEANPPTNSDSPQKSASDSVGELPPESEPPAKSRIPAEESIEPLNVEPENEPLSSSMPPELQPFRPSISRSNHEELTSVEDAWKRALRGHPEDAYRQMRQRISHGLTDSDVYLRLYWLLRLFPEIDSAKHRSQWLIAALTQSRLSGPAWELYTYELARFPDQIEAADHRTLLDVTRSPARLYDLLDVRWRAATQVERWDLIQSDLNKVRRITDEESSEVWARILFRAVDLVAWSSHPVAREIMRTCRQGLDELAELQFELRNAFNHYDLLVEMQSQMSLQGFHSVTPEFARLVRDCWSESLDDLKPRIEALLETWVQDPPAALQMLSEIRRHAGVAFHHFYSVIKRLGRNHTEYDFSDRATHIKDNIWSFLSAHRTTLYVKLRPELLRFCVVRRLVLTDILNHYETEIQNIMLAGTLDALNDDVALAMLLEGIKVFWTRESSA